MSVRAILDKKAKKYGINYTPHSQKEYGSTKEEANWEAAKRKLNTLTNDYEKVFDYWIDEYFELGKVIDENLEKKSESGKKISASNDLLYWRVLNKGEYRKQKTTSLYRPRKLMGYAVQLVVYEKEGSTENAFYVMFNDKLNTCYRVDLVKKMMPVSFKGQTLIF